MKNMRKLAVISLVVMMMVTAVGYALWSDEVRIEGSASTATFGVKFIPQGTSSNVTIKSSDCAEFELKDIVPGEHRVMTLAVENEGSVTAKLSNADLRVLRKNEFGWNPYQFEISDGNAQDIPAGQVRTITITVWIDEDYIIPGTLGKKLVDADDGQLVKYTDYFTVIATYKQ